MAALTLFLDDGGVMNDNSQRGPQWQRLVGEFFPPRLGGTPQAWADANREVAAQLLRRHDRLMNQGMPVDFDTYYRDYQRTWVQAMCDRVGVVAPPEDECLTLARQATDYITPRLRTAYPGAVQAIGELRASGYTLHTASGGASHELAGYLGGMGVQECFGRLYGADLVNTLKGSRRYYERVFADADVPPGQAVVVDDNPTNLAQAKALGAITVLVGETSPEGGVTPDRVIPALTVLPEMVAGLE